MLKRVFYLFVVIFWVPDLAAADQNFFREINQQKTDKLTERNAEFIDEMQFTFKRHRILASNPQQLDSKIAKNITFNFFDDVELDAVVSSTNELHESKFWTMRLVEPLALEPSEYISAGFSLESIYSALREFTISGLNYSVNRDTGEALDGYTKLPEHIISPDGIRSKKDKYHLKKFRSISLHLKNHNSGATYQVFPLPNNPKYSLVAEIDPNKLISLPHVGEPPSHALQQKLDQLEVHLESVKQKHRGKKSLKVMEEVQ